MKFLRAFFLVALTCNFAFAGQPETDAPADAAANKTIKVKLEGGLNCEGCADYVTTYLKKLDGLGTSYVSVSLQTILVQEKDGKSVSDDFLTTAIKEAGYKVTKIERSDLPLETMKTDLQESEKTAPAN